MRRKKVSPALLALLLMCMFSSAFRIQQVEAEPTTIIVPDDYEKIQWAVGNATDEDIISVKSGTYYEHITIHKSLSLIGENRETTIIDGDNVGNVIEVTADNVTIAGFTIRRGSCGVYAHGSFNPNYYISGSNISHNIITNNGLGIHLDMSLNNNISGNNITNNRGHGVITWVYSSNNAIIGNNITHNGHIGVAVHGESDSVISGNNITHNGWDGINIGSYSGATVYRNNISSNGEAAVSVPTRGYALIEGNTITNNWRGIDCPEGGITGAAHVTASENLIMNNHYGVALSAAGESTYYHNNIINNTIQAYYEWTEPDFWISGPCILDDGYPSGGNYWSNHTGADDYRGPNQNETGSDGISDTPHIIDEYNQDNYPLMHPYGSIRNLDTSLTYLTIQSAIDAPETLDGHTIFVESGTYYEHVVLNKTVSLIGEDRDTTTIDGGNVGNGVEVTADNATVVGFTISNSWSGIYMVGSTGITINNNHLANNNNGVFFDMSWYGDKTISGNTITNSYSGISIWSSSNIAISGNNIIDNLVGVSMVEVFEITISGNNITNNGRGTSLTASSSSIFLNNLIGNECAIDVGTYSAASIYDNNLSSNECGVSLGGWHVRGIIRGNTITNNSVGINQAYEDVVDCASSIFENTITENNIGINLPYYFGTSSHIYHNNFVNNTIHAYGSDYSEADNVLDDGYPSGGNYWSSYIGVDLYRGPFQNETGSDGIVDIPYMMDVNTIDFYPLMKPYGGQYDIGIVSLNCSKNVVGHGHNLTITVKVINYGIHDETFNVIVYANTSIIQTRNTVLTSRNSTAVTFNWNTTGFAYGNYTISTAADTVPGETDIADNIFIDGTVSVTIWGDVDGDGDVDGFDLTKMCGAYGSTSGDLDWDETCDIDGNGVIDGFDLTPACGNYGKTL